MAAQPRNTKFIVIRVA